MRNTELAQELGKEHYVGMNGFKLFANETNSRQSYFQFEPCNFT